MSEHDKYLGMSPTKASLTKYFGFVHLKRKLALNQYVHTNARLLSDKTRFEECYSRNSRTALQIRSNGRLQINFEF